MLHAWYETIFKKIGGKFGEFDEVSKDTIERYCLESGKALVRIGSHCFVNEESELDSFERFILWQLGKSMPWRLPKEQGKLYRGRRDVCR